MEWLLAFFIGIAVGVSGTMGFEMFQPAKTNITQIDSKTYIDTTQNNQQSQYQVQEQVTSINNTVYSNYQISTNFISNSIKISSTNTNYTVTTTNKP